MGFKYFVDGLLQGKLGFAESAGSSFLRRDGTVWTTDKDGIIAALLAAEVAAKMKEDPGQIYRQLTEECGDPLYNRSQAPATRIQKAALEKIDVGNIQAQDLAGDKILNILTDAPGDGISIGGVKVVTQNGWFAARPSGTEDIYKIYAESFSSNEHLQKIETEAQAIVSKVFASSA